MKPQAAQLARWRSAGLEPFKLTEGRSGNVSVSFQELRPVYHSGASPADPMWEAWWYDFASKTGGALSSAEPMAGSAFGALLKRQMLTVARLQGVVPPPPWAGSRQHPDDDHIWVEPPAVDAPFPSPFPSPVPEETIASEPGEDWGKVETTAEDRSAARARVKRIVKCRWCGNVTGSLSRTCQHMTCITKTYRDGKARGE